MFKCKRCRYTTSDKSNLKRHLTTKHECICTNESISQEELLKELYPKKTGKKYHCMCGKAYSYPSGLSLHKKTCNEKKCVIEKNQENEKNNNEQLSILLKEIKELNETIKNIFL